MKNEEKGVLVGTDKNQEWLLPWWYFHYSATNTFPITFGNFGMSKKALAWCEKRGSVLEAPSSDFVTKKEIISSDLRKKWDQNRAATPFWKSRPAWFLKPLLMQQSPYQQTLYLDLDCQVYQNLNPIFDFSNNPGGFSIAQDPIVCFPQSKNFVFPPNITRYNSGVIVYQKNSPLIEKWASYCLEKNHLFPGDQDVLEYILSTEDFHHFSELPILYNWSTYFTQTLTHIFQHFPFPSLSDLIQHISLSDLPSFSFDLLKYQELLQKELSLDNIPLDPKELPISICHWHGRGKENIRNSIEFLKILSAYDSF
ncbi:MAG: hypothetical protein WCP39_00185 [Chlamydiota bacterium]